ncbi:unnamed protein product [Urochloa humidicola]
MGPTSRVPAWFRSRRSACPNPCGGGRASMKETGQAGGGTGCRGAEVEWRSMRRRRRAFSRPVPAHVTGLAPRGIRRRCPALCRIRLPLRFPVPTAVDAATGGGGGGQGPPEVSPLRRAFPRHRRRTSRTAAARSGGMERRSSGQSRRADPNRRLPPPEAPPGPDLACARRPARRPVHRGGAWFPRGPRCREEASGDRLPRGPRCREEARGTHLLEARAPAEDPLPPGLAGAGAPLARLPPAASA